jgi:hypothetical protein
MEVTLSRWLFSYVPIGWLSESGVRELACRAMRMTGGRRVDLLAVGAPESDGEEAWVEWLQKEECTPNHVDVRRTYFTGEGWSSHVDQKWQKGLSQLTVVW